MIYWRGQVLALAQNKKGSDWAPKGNLLICESRN